ncbi:MAG TPA: hypothetical protein VES61_00185 [Gaiellaceae bacterium]|nr:hypothetical protein [Gaiellaceae bacterium]
MPVEPDALGDAARACAPRADQVGLPDLREPPPGALALGCCLV